MGGKNGVQCVPSWVQAKVTCMTSGQTVANMAEARSKRMPGPFRMSGDTKLVMSSAKPYQTKTAWAEVVPGGCHYECKAGGGRDCMIGCR